MKLYISSPPDFEVLDASKKNEWNHLQVQVISSGARPGLNCEKAKLNLQIPPTGRQDQWPWVDKKERPDILLALRTPDLLQGRTVLNNPRQSTKYNNHKFEAKQPSSDQTASSSPHVMSITICCRAAARSYRVQARAPTITL